jgi:hypothetical protein
MMVPLPNCFSICASAAASALAFRIQAAVCAGLALRFVWQVHENLQLNQRCTKKSSQLSEAGELSARWMHDHVQPVRNK